MKKQERSTWSTKLRAFGTFAKASISRLLKRRKTSESFTIYQSLKSINILLWNDILETHNPLLLDPNFDEAKTYSEEQRKLVNDKFSLLYDEYFIKLNNRRAKSEMQKTQSKIGLQLKITMLLEAVNALTLLGNNQKYLKDGYKKELKIYEVIKIIVPNFTEQKLGTIEDNLNKLKKILKTLELEYERKYGLDTENATDYNFNKQVVDIEQVLGRSLDLRDCNVLKWIEYLNKAQELVKHNEKLAEHGKRKR